ncbi:FecCD family ABC transporter permease [Actinomadura macra]|uniref:FecCD family ABC transporter permease n=1 Tax=Actinomadura macra TaxID=46164 RepID=UPI00083705D3|nr:iron ABC transporter permease [Actinomadura macra]
MATATKSPPGRTARERGNRRLPGAALLPGLALALAALCVVAAGAGQVDVPPDQVIGSLLHHLGLDVGPRPTAAQGDNALWIVRFPRVALAVVVGASLGCSGAVMQGVFGNPLAEPAVIGVSWGSAVGAATVIVFGLSTLGSWTIMTAAFVSGLVTTLLVYVVSRSGGGTEVVTLLLTGIAVNAVASALLGLLMFAAGDDALRAITSWNLGSLAGANWNAVAAVTPVAAAGMVVALALAHRLDLLSLGERTARHLGVDVERLRFTAIVVIALMTSAAVAFAGVISFVGLVVPHLVRLVAGPGHRTLIPASALGGAIVLVAADTVARTAIPYQELPLGVLTALLGGPFFFWLLRRARGGPGNWS